MSAVFSQARSKLLCNLRPLVARSSARSFSAIRLNRVLVACGNNRSLVPNTGGSSSLRRFSNAGQTLSDLLARELAEEIEDGNTDMPPELAELKESLEEQDWKIVDEGSMTKLYRTIGSNKVVVNFHCQDTVQSGDEEEYEMEDGEELPSPFRFLVTCSKAGKTLVFNCLSEEGTAQIEAVAITTDDNEAILDNGGIKGKQYQGPEFQQLDQGVQDSFHEYLLTEIGIDEDLAAFVSMYADYKEQSEYVQFLKDSKSMID